MEEVTGEEDCREREKETVCRRCFEVILTKFQVQIGAQGTDEDVRVKVRDCIWN